MKRKTTTPRSEQVRARRKATARTPRLKKRGKAAAPASAAPLREMPPVVVRGGFPSGQTTKRRRKGKPVRRRFEVATGGGVAMQLPAIPMVRPGWRLLSLALTATFALLLYYLWTSPTYQVQAAALQGNTYLTEDLVNQVLAVGGKPVFAISPRELETALHQAFPGLLVDVSVRVGLPAKVFVSVTEREPALAWVQNGETLWIDSDGYAFAPAGENPDLITVSATGAPPKPPQADANSSGEEPSPAGETDPLADVLSPKPFMFPQMVAGIQEFQRLRGTTDLRFDPQHGFIWHDEKRDWDVYLGFDLSQVEEKMTVYRAIKAFLRENGIPATLVSVEHLHAPYYR